MAAKRRRLKIVVILVVAISLAAVLLAPSPVSPATVYVVGAEAPLQIQDYSAVPQPVVEDAGRLAAELFVDDQNKQQKFTGQLLATYVAARDKDVVVIFNSGGWGWSSVLDSPYGSDFVAGIESALADLGYASLMLDHYRTGNNINGLVSELLFAVDKYPSKAIDLASRIEFLTRHLPGIKVIVTGMSNGASICEDAMLILRDNQQVYSIQLGPPFWNGSTISDRALVLRSNGIVDDTFSQGDIITIISINVETMLGISQEDPGNILLYIGAPGHDYRWQHPAVRSQIIDFLEGMASKEQ
jgi:pimeloyl-ACP methyl ester carboxylesterase